MVARLTRLIHERSSHADLRCSSPNIRSSGEIDRLQCMKQHLAVQVASVDEATLPTQSQLGTPPLGITVKRRGPSHIMLINCF